MGEVKGDAQAVEISLELRDAPELNREFSLSLRKLPSQFLDDLKRRRRKSNRTSRPRLAWWPGWAGHTLWSLPSS
jgi:hypothetical protein